MKLALTGSVFLCLLIATSACSSDAEPTSSSSSSTSGGSSSSSGSSGATSGSSSGSSGSSGDTAGGGCTGAIADCGIGSLSDAQQKDMCSLILTSIDVPAGTKFECTQGDKSGLFITVNTQDQCAAQKAPAACKVKVSQLIECYKSAKKDACAAFADDGPCGVVFSSKECTGG